MELYKSKLKESIDISSDVFNVKDLEIKKIEHIFKKYNLNFKEIQKAIEIGIMTLYDKKMSNEIFLFTVLVSMIKHGDLK